MSLVCGTTALEAQVPDVSAYYLNLLSRSGESPVSDAGVADFQRLRLMWLPFFGPLGLDVAYEHTLQVRGKDVLGAGALAVVPDAEVD